MQRNGIASTEPGEGIVVNGDVMILKLKKDMDHHNADELKMQIDELLEDYRIKYLILDFKELEFMDSSGIGFVLGRYRKINQYHGEVFAVNIDRSLDRIFRISGLYKIIKSERNVETALKKLDGGNDK